MRSGMNREPGALVIETRKSVSGPSWAPAAAAATLFSVGRTSTPAAFRILADGRPLEMA